MKRSYPTLAVVITAVLLCISCSQKNPKPAPQNEGKKMKGMAKKDRMEEAMAFEVESTKDPLLGFAPRQHLLQAFEDVRTMSNAQRGALPGITWNERGPSNVAGRTRSILIDKNDPTGNTIWAGSVGGGLWKGTNFTTASYNWAAVNNLFPNLAVTTIAQNPSTFNTMYFGTGEGFYNADAIQGGGLWKSTNGGVTWTHLTFTSVTSPTSIFSHVQKIVIKNVAGIEHVFVATRNGGVQRSIDGGATFTQVLTSVASANQAADLEISKNGDIYASLGLRTNADRIYRSPDNGTTWIPCVGGLPPAGYGRIEIACAPGMDSTVYASFENIANGRCLGIFKTTTAGLAWLPVTNADGGDWAGAQAWYDMAIAVDPDNADHVVIGGLDTYNSTDGGGTWTQMSSWFGGAPQYVHADHHELKFFKPASGQTYLYFGNDGGVFFSANASASQPIPVALEKNNGYNVTQFYHGSIGPVPGSDKLLAGTQDNGTQYFTTPGINATAEVTGGDGAFSHIDDDNPNIQVSQYVFNHYWITNNNWTSYETVTEGSNTGRFINPSDYDSRVNSLYGANSTNNYTLIKNVGTTNEISKKPATAFGGQVSAVTVSPNTISRVFFGIGTGRIVRVDNADGPTPTFTNLTTSIPQAGFISEIAVQEGDDNHIIYCLSNFGVNSIWETTNGGTSWTSIEGNFTQNVPVRAIMFSPSNNDHALIGTDIGVYSTDNLNGTSTEWGETNDGLARVSIRHLEYRRGEGTMMVVTHGRGVYTSSSLEMPAVYFGSGNQPFTETTTSSTGCRKYTDVNVPVILSKNPSAPVQVNVFIHALTSATNLHDFEIITPMPLTFTTASTQNVVVRIYDDAATELSEKAVLELSINNPAATNAKKGAVYLDFITITDNDKAPSSAGASTVIFSENWEGGPGTWAGFNTGTATEPNAWGIFDNCDNSINAKTAVIYNQATNSCGYDNTQPSGAIIYRTIDAINQYNLSIEFDWKGFGEIGFDEGHVVFDTTTDAIPSWEFLQGASALSGSTTVVHVAANLPDEVSNRSFRLGFIWTNDDNTGSNPAFSVDNIQVKAIPPAPVQLQVDAATAPTHYVGPMETVHFFDNNGNVIGTVNNKANVNLGCVKLEVDRAGGGPNVPFWSNNAATYLAAKTYKLTAPGAPATGLNYDVSLYYTEAEINTWKSGTGYQDNDVKIVKVTGRPVSEITPSSQHNADVTVAPNTTMSRNVVGDYIFTASFNSFSGFGLGVPNQSALPITLLNFKGAIEKYKAVLSWNTSSEVNNKGFYLEKSFDGTRFAPVTFVNGHGTSSIQHSYFYNDYDLRKAIMYYRLKQVDNDGRFVYSRIVQLQLDKEGFVRVMPNPFRSSLQVMFGETVNTAEAQLYNVAGTRLYSKNLQLNGQSSATLNFGGISLPKGEYVLVLFYNNKRKQVKVMKE